MTKERARAKAEKYLEWADKADQQAQKLSNTWYAKFKDFDFTEPIKIGHHSQRRHEKVFEQRDRFFAKQIELSKKAKRFREKASNLIHFANTNKGDAEKRRETQRQELDKYIKVGDIIVTMYGDKEVLKVNKKTYTVQGSIGETFTIQKHLIFGSKLKNDTARGATPRFIKIK